MYKIFIAWRFLWSRLVSYIGAGLLALAVMLFIVVMAVMEGMGEILRENIRKSNAHVEILAPAGPGIADWRGLMERIASMDHVEGVTPFVTGVGQAESTLYRFQCLVRGVDLDKERTVGGLGPYLDEEMTFESVDEATKTIKGAIVGHRVAQRSEINPAKRPRIRLSVQQPDGESTGVAVFYISGKFKTDSLWFDLNLLISLKDAQKLFGTGDRVTGLGVWLDDYTMAYRVKRRIQHMLIETGGYILSDDEKRFFESLSAEPQSLLQTSRRAGLPEHEARKLLSALIEKGAAREVGHMEGHYVESTEPQVKTWAEQQPDVFRAVAWEAWIMRIILSLVISFVTVLIFCLLWIMVDVKVPDIGILVALGARTAGVVWIFVFDGLIVGLVGAMAGLGLGVFIAWKIDWATALLSWLGLNVFPEEMFYGTADKLPCKVELVDVVLVVVVAVVCSVLASIPPALKAAVQDPIESLRHE